MRWAFTMAMVLSWVMASGLGCAPDQAGQPTTKSDVKNLAKAEWIGDFCEQYQWYADGICDPFCINPDPDCTVDCADPSAMRACQTDADCGCGTNVMTGECDFGIVSCIDESLQCPDFCGGFSGNLILVCQDGLCQQQQAVIGGCRTDEDCVAGTVCEPTLVDDCGTTDCMACVAGCRDDADCGQEQVCQTVECFTVPCPGQCTTIEADCIDPVQSHACEIDEDCKCGTNLATGECDFGMASCINEFDQCPDFCSGIGGHLTIVCKDRKCQQVG